VSRIPAPTQRTAALLALVALSGLVLPLALAALAAVAVVAAALADFRLARRVPPLDRRAPALLYRGVGSPFRLEPEGRAPGALRLRQPLPPDLRLDPPEADGRLEGVLAPLRRGRHVLPAAAVRSTGPLGLGRAFGRALGEAEVLAYPDLPAAWRLALAVRQGRFRESGRRTRGPLGLGTDFESVRDYLPDDDVRQINWRATSRLGRPMSNQYRVEQDRDVVCIVDTGRLMAAPLDDRTRLDAAVDAAVAVAAVADEVGDRCGTLAFDLEVRRSVAPRRRGGRAVVQALFDVEPTSVESDYELAFHAVGDAKRAFVLVFTDLLEPTAARPLAEALPVLRRRHVVAVASVVDPDLAHLVAREPADARDVYTTVAALDVLAARARAVALLRRAGADVIEAGPDALGAACVRAYLRAKARARL
jgi:uncharacterized protein (DUF58 family)